jgi:hemerythrin-like domain-containing protein
MCSYCGCRAITMIGRLSTEHVEIINATGVLRRVALDGDGDATDTAVVELAALLDPHTTAEEQGLFAELRLDEDFAGHVDALCAEHREIDARLAQVAGGDHAEVEALENLLRRHIDKEENGIFPAAAVALDGAAWDRIQQRAP